MKRYFILTLSILMLVFSFGYFSSTVALHSAYELSEGEWFFSKKSGNVYRSESFSVTGDVKLEVTTSGGNITITEGTSDKVEVTLFARRGGSYLSPGDFNEEDFEIIILQRGNTIIASVNKNRGGWNWRGGDPSFSFEVKTPSNTNSELRTSGGNISISGLTGKQEARTSGGNITLEKMEGYSEVRTSGGNINVNNFSGNLNARTSGGNIRLSEINGSADVRTSGGNIRGENISGNLEAVTSGGSINVSATNIDKNLILRTSGGNVTASVPGNIGYALNLRGSRVNTNNLANFSGSSSRNRVEGRIGDSSRQLDLRTSGGTVNVTFQ